MVSDVTLYHGAQKEIRFHLGSQAGHSLTPWASPCRCWLQDSTFLKSTRMRRKKDCSQGLWAPPCRYLPRYPGPGFSTLTGCYTPWNLSCLGPCGTCCCSPGPGTQSRPWGSPRPALQGPRPLSSRAEHSPSMAVSLSRTWVACGVSCAAGDPQDLTRESLTTLGTVRESRGRGGALGSP